MVGHIKLQKKLVDEQMDLDDETTAYQFIHMLSSQAETGFLDVMWTDEATNGPRPKA